MSATAKKAIDRKEANSERLRLFAGLELPEFETREPDRMESLDWRAGFVAIAALCTTAIGFFTRRHLQRVDDIDKRIAQCEQDQTAIKENTRSHSETLERMQHESKEATRLLHSRIGTEVGNLEAKLTTTIRHESEMIIKAVRGSD